MLKRSSRLTTKLFNETIKHGKVVHSTFFVVRVHSPSGADSFRLAAVAPVKIAKTAVLRNRTRRRIYSAVKPFVSKINSKTNIILIAKANFIQNYDIEAVKSDIKDIFVKAKLLR